MSWYGWAIIIFVIEIIIGIVIWWIVDECACHSLDGKELIAVLLFWPILGIVLGIMGVISLVFNVYKGLQKDLEEDNKE